MAANRQISVLMFPWLGHGHISPHLELARKLTNRNFKIYICSTPANIKSIKHKVGEKYSPFIHLVELHLPAFPGLPPQLHTTNGLPPHLMPTLKLAFEEGRFNFLDIVQKLQPDLMIYDLLQPWAPIMASVFNIPAVEFITSSATMLSWLIHLFKKPGIKYPFPSIYFRDYEKAFFNRMQKEAQNRDKEILGVMDCIWRSNKIVLIKSFKEIEGKYIDYLSHLTGKKMIPIGPVVQSPGNEYDNSHIIEWLNEKEKLSTVFVSFGSEYFLTKEDNVEIAYGLELSNVNFIWVLRFPLGDKTKIEGALPEGFLERVGKRGLVVEKWAPQAEILSHANTGGFVSHCGWSSVMESMKFGVPLIAMPMHLDQPVNARLVGEVGVGIEVLRDSNGHLRRQEVAAVINQVVLEKSGEAVRTKARKMSEIIELKGEEEIDMIVEEFEQLCKEAKRPNYC